MRLKLADKITVDKIINNIKKNIKKNKRFFKLIFIFFFLIAIVTNITSLDIGTGSLKYKYFLSTSLIKATKGEYAVIDGHDTRYIHDLKFIKKIVGTAGDKIAIKNNQILINQNPIGFLLKETQDNKPLTPIKEQIIPKDYVLVVGEHKRSFDSRYAEFGLVKLTHIKGRALAIW
jgi:signal peptidase I